MALLLSCQSLTKAYGARPLFASISMGLSDTERMGLIGPNGAGKSTLLKIWAGLETPDSGTVAPRRGLRVAYLSQEDTFPEGATVESVLTEALSGEPLDETEREVRIEVALSRVGFARRDEAAQTLSGGWRKRLALARALVQDAELLLIDEPTNHLDLEGVLWLEKLLQDAPFAFVVISHDRVFLENVSRRVVELNPQYAEGYLSINGGYSDFLSAREEYLSAQATRQAALTTQVKREIEWLRRGPQARTTKAQSRIQQAGEMMGELAELKFRSSQGKTAGVDFTSSGRQTRVLLAAKGIGKSLGGNQLFDGLDLTLSPGVRLGLIGPNGSGKTTLIRLLTGELEPDTGTIKRADGLRVVWFDQNRAQLDKSLTLREALSPNSETVIYRGNPQHVSGWAKRFLFTPEQLPVPLRYLSGGEQARILIAQLMLQPADVLVLDEPTNDLDIPTLEVLEESLSSFPGALVLVTHDRYLLDRLSTDLLALDGQGGTRFFVGLDQWEAAQTPSPAPVAKSAVKSAVKSAAPKPALPASRLTTAERRELGQIEAKIEAAEADVATWSVRWKTLPSRRMLPVCRRYGMLCRLPARPLPRCTPAGKTWKPAEAAKWARLIQGIFRQQCIEQHGGPAVALFRVQKLKAQARAFGPIPPHEIRQRQHGGAGGGGKADRGWPDHPAGNLPQTSAANAEVVELGGLPGLPAMEGDGHALRLGPAPPFAPPADRQGGLTGLSRLGVPQPLQQRQRLILPSQSVFDSRIFRAADIFRLFFGHILHHVSPLCLLSASPAARLRHQRQPHTPSPDPMSSCAPRSRRQ